MKPLREVLFVLETLRGAGYCRPEVDVPHLRFELERIERAQAVEAEVMRAAEDAIEQLAPDGTPAMDRRWREEQTTYTAARTRLAALNLEELMLRSDVECELWWARKRALVAA
ncbi:MULTISPECIES: hypothetical protein [unclassified Corallococcus]|uniref:hypothetical protein n=1 Tax=unclassified Corallococcus TaxID=2685029 RepID=UPI001A8DF1A7|nr:MULTISPECIES: hypothetical protein [unclassified Corallococcus]MBN9687098.1 hypothetical protein [Corallococcus sp. NCSPR001]WAS89074.1 hypothetical protein O0N60_19330 [Corallococcus sp. NCRR]